MTGHPRRRPPRERIAEAFRRLAEKRRAALIIYFTAGFPDLRASEETFVRLAAWGADLLEIGVPFSDPVADGPVIQASGQRALASGVSLRKALGLCARLARRVACPLLIMSYYNPIHRHGLARFASTARRAGVCGVIVPDLALEERGPLERELRRQGLALIRFVTPATPAARLKRIASGAEGFLYCVSVEGVTGARPTLPRGLRAGLRTVRRRTGIPVAVGFGISSPDQAAFLAPACDGIIMGSRIIQLIGEGRFHEAERTVRSCREALG